MTDEMLPQNMSGFNTNSSTSSYDSLIWEHHFLNKRKGCIVYLWKNHITSITYLPWKFSNSSNTCIRWLRDTFPGRKHVLIYPKLGTSCWSFILWKFCFCYLCALFCARIKSSDLEEVPKVCKKLSFNLFLLKKITRIYRVFFYWPPP